MSKDEYDAVEPFKALHIRERSQILADGFAEPLDWGKSGALLDAKDWHKQLDDPESIVLDCRNSYESDVGTFDGAIPLNTTFFRESWDALDEVLRDVPLDKPIMTFCTGGIRCVKINAYLHQKMGYSNVSRLKGGIINYAKQLGEGDMPISTTTISENIPQSGLNRTPNGDNTTTTTISSSSKDDGGGEDHFELIDGSNGCGSKGVLNKKSKFRGVNYVFDERMGAKITDDLFANCETCGVPCGTYTNCRGNSCHVRFLQCPSCQTSYEGCCSQACQMEAKGQKLKLRPQPGQVQRQTGRVVNAKMAPRAARAMSTSAKGGSDFSTSGSGSGSSDRAPRPSTVLDANQPTTSNPAYIFADALLEDTMDYCERLSSPEPALMSRLRQETAVKYADSPGAARMISGHLQGAMLTLLAKMARAKTILELGSFTGYSALCFAEAMKNDKDGTVYSCDIDPDAAEVAQRYFNAFNEEAGRNIIQFTLQPAAEALAAARVRGTLIDLVFIDADKMQYPVYLRADGRKRGWRRMVQWIKIKCCYLMAH